MPTPRQLNPAQRRYFARALHHLRTEHELTQSALAAEVGVTSMSISHWERGRNDPTVAAIVLLADYFEVSIDYLLGRERGDEPDADGAADA